jgi:hypothetical protein
MSTITSQDSYDRNEEILRHAPYYSLITRPDPQFRATIGEMQEGVKKPLEERVRILGEKEGGKYVEISVDSAIRYERYSDLYQKFESEIWGKEFDKWRERSLYALAGAAVSGLLAFRDAIPNLNIASEAPPLLAVTLPLVAVVCASVASYCFAKTLSVKEPLKQWNNPPLNTLAEQRAEVYTSDKPYAHLLCPEGVLHPVEKQALHDRYTRAFCKQLLTQDVSDAEARDGWKAQFYDHNPFEFETCLPESLRGATKDVEKLRSVTLHSQIKHGKTLQDDIQQWISLFVTAKQHEKAKAVQWEMSKFKIAQRDLFAKRAQLLKDPAVNSEAKRQKIEVDCDNQTLALRETLEKNIDALERSCDEQIEAYQKTWEGHLKLMNEEFEERYYQAAKEILVHAEKAMNGGVYQPIDFGGYFPWIKNL